MKRDIQGYDLDPDMVKIARQNAALAGVDGRIHFQQRDVKDLSHNKKYGFLITESTVLENDWKKNLHCHSCIKSIGERFAALDDWSAYIITSYEEAEKYMGRKADKNRKIYNGMIKTYYYQFLGKKPPKKTAKTEIGNIYLDIDRLC